MTIKILGFLLAYVGFVGFILCLFAGSDRKPQEWL